MASKGTPLVMLGIDPGMTCGLSVLLSAQGGQQLLHSGVVKSKSSMPLEVRLRAIYDEVCRLILEHGVCVAAIEDIFVGRASQNAKSAIMLAHARASAMLACVAHSVPLGVYGNSTVKRHVVGNHQASKADVQACVQGILKLDEPIRPQDASDSAAIAITHWDALVKGGELLSLTNEQLGVWGVRVEVRKSGVMRVIRTRQRTGATMALRTVKSKKRGQQRVVAPGQQLLFDV